jgi:nucleoside-diphosphate-sugar epimerase|tara:strand:+ start:3567 stop:4532 length:966 start_codon:yes stop_codon:yes gene_type:complete
MKKILVFGSEGYIGRIIVDFFTRKNYQVFGFDNLTFRQKNLLKKKNYIFLKHSIHDTKKIIKLIKEEDIDEVLLLGGLVGDPIVKKYPKLSNKTNLTSIKNFIEQLNNKFFGRLIYVSTCSNYGISKTNTLLTEKSRLNPVSLYATQKVAIEKYLQNNKFSFTHTILRFATAFGVSERMRFDLTINEFCKDSFIFNNIEVYEPYRFRPYCHVKDFARAIFKVYRAKHDLISSEIFNCGNQKNNFTKSKICKILKTFNKNLKIKLNNNIVDKRNYRVSFSKIEKKLSFKCLYSVEYGVREILGYLKKNKKVDYKKLGNYIIH